MNQSSPSQRWLVCAVAATAVAALALACGGGTTQPSTQQPPVTTTPTLTGVTVSPNSVVGGGAVQGTVTLSAATSSAASVAVSSNSAAATVSGPATVAAGAASGTFTVNTTAVSASTPVSISASFNGATQSTALTVTPVPPPSLAANFVVTSLSAAQRRGPNDTAPVPILPAGTVDACPLTIAGTPAFDCVFNGAGSTPSGSIQTYIWTYFVGPRTRTETDTNPQHKPTESSCGFFTGLSTDSSGGLQFISMRVDLQVRDAAGNLSAVKSSQNIRIFPAGQCGYGF